VSAFTLPALPAGIMATVLKVALHRPEYNADFGEGVTHVEIEDEAAGFFVKIGQPVPFDVNDSRLCIEAQELQAVNAIAQALLRQPGAVNSGAQAPFLPIDGAELTQSPGQPLQTPERAAPAVETLRRCISALSAAEERAREDMANMLALENADNLTPEQLFVAERIEYADREALANLCALAIAEASQTSQALQADAIAMATLRGEAAQ